MREHRYRGQRISDHAWVYGSLILSENGKRAYIGRMRFLSDGGPVVTFSEVIPSTVGEWTGKQDSKGRDIWEEDRVRIKSDEYGYDYDSIVMWDETSGCLVLDYPPERDYDIAPVGWILDLVEKENGTVEVIGHAQPEGE